MHVCMVQIGLSFLLFAFGSSFVLADKGTFQHNVYCEKSNGSHDWIHGGGGVLDAQTS